MCTQRIGKESERRGERREGGYREGKWACGLGGFFAGHLIFIKFHRHKKISSYLIFLLYNFDTLSKCLNIHLKM